MSKFEDYSARFSKNIQKEIKSKRTQVKESLSRLKDLSANRRAKLNEHIKGQENELIEFEPAPIVKYAGPENQPEDTKPNDNHNIKVKYAGPETEEEISDPITIIYEPDTPKYAGPEVEVVQILDEPIIEVKYAGPEMEVVQILDEPIIEVKYAGPEMEEIISDPIPVEYEPDVPKYAGPEIEVIKEETIKDIKVRYAGPEIEVIKEETIKDIKVRYAGPEIEVIKEETIKDIKVRYAGPEIETIKEGQEKNIISRYAGPEKF